ncbi:MULTISPECIES: SRPBCC family protein [Sphingobacterium]|jgi:carbon monoxide dehydrogenase subunit G|uniref:SRPBCC family protein n=1 Tax=Sphingobacterium litopenaei TaxID=2763500 RepID=A0ABR7YAY9_9SPHI|nr:MULTISPECIES: SRPBCC family protein [Sphingobacterium]MBD1428466.1 SRPBCC family protein [Sphingobacterium litopenaei]NGM71730.1 SRPBCC family protein [Sphingobacterium sp. SGL-16]
MTIIQNSVVINKPIKEVYDFLSDLNNHEQLMPENIYNWSSTADEARFTIKNMAKLALKISERVENKEIVCVPSEEAPFEVKLAWQVEEVSANETKATFIIEAQLNMMMKMMASGPLKKLVDHQTGQLKEKLG